MADAKARIWVLNYQDRSCDLKSYYKNNKLKVNDKYILQCVKLMDFHVRCLINVYFH